MIGIIRKEREEIYKRRKGKRREPNRCYDDVLVKKCKEDYDSCLWKMKGVGTI